MEQMSFEDGLAHWENLKRQVKHLQETERAYREGLFAALFTSPTEGVNEYALPDGRVVKGTYKITRKLDPEKLEELVKGRKVTAKVAERIQNWHVTLDLTEYRELTDKQRAAVDAAIEAKPALPTLEVVWPAPAEATAGSERQPGDPF